MPKAIIMFIPLILLIPLLLIGGIIALIIFAAKKRQALLAQQAAAEAALLAAVENARTEREFAIAKLKLELFRDKINNANIQRSLNGISSSITMASLTNNSRHE